MQEKSADNVVARESHPEIYKKLTYARLRSKNTYRSEPDGSRTLWGSLALFGS
jgi:hypothetical protein